ncbi:hypothetical protein V8F33_001273 [Rhypophila sp. PSN 637]
MPQFFGLSQLQNAITTRALPTLEQLATNPNRLDRSLNNRFERDDPPPYALVSTLDGIGVYTPGGRYSDEVKQEHDLLDKFYSSANINAHAHDLLKFPKGYQRRDVIIRRNIRKRWQRLVKWWKERGHWPPGWKWPHESPSLEPPEEDLTPLNTDELDFTPSEVDALEAIGPNLPPKLPPQRDSPPKWNLFGGGFKPVDASKDARLGAAAEPEDLQEAEEQPPNSPPRRRGRPRKRSQQAEVAAAPRCSARVAARNVKPPVPPPPETAPKETRTRRPRGPPAAPPPRNGTSAADAPKKRGRPRKTQDGGITKPAASSSKKGKRASGRRAAVAAAAGAANGNATETAAAAAGKRPRGRPRRADNPG